MAGILQICTINKLKPSPARNDGKWWAFAEAVFLRMLACGI